MKVVREGSKVLYLFKINNDLFTHEVRIPELSCSFTPCVEQQVDDLDNLDLDPYEQRVSYDEYEKIYAEAVTFINKGLVRLIDVTVEQWLDLKYEDHKTMDKKIKDGVIGTWLIRSYKRKFKDYMEIKKKKEVHGFNANIEYDPSSEDFAKWLASKFYNHTNMNWYTNNALWMYWIKGDDEVLLTDEKVSDLGGKKLDEENKIVELLKIEDDIFNFETPLCKDFK
ncbi:hypothetical protein Tco_0471921 [Tanacetum coccineum]